MTKQQYMEKLAAYKAELARQDAKGSTGSMGKLAEEVLRRFILAEGVKADCRVGCRKVERVDVRRKGYGKIEIKTGCGAVAYGCDLTKEDICEDVILPNCDYVCWAPFTGFLTEDNMTAMTWVFTRQQFIDTLEAIGKKGLQSSVKVSKGGAQLNIQTITPRMEDRLWEILENMQTVKEVFGRG